MQLYWQAKIWGLLHDPIFKALYDNNGRGGTGWWDKLPAMREWVDLPPEQKDKLINYVKLADQISSASDRGAIGNLEIPVDYNTSGLELSHLLSGAKQPSWQTKPDRHQQVADLRGERRKQYLQEEEQRILDSIPVNIRDGDARQLFWWLWRCLPVAACQQFDSDPSLLLMPAETRLPDGSIWSHSSMTSAVAGAIIGYDMTMAEFQAIDPQQLWYKAYSHPYLVSFTFTPVQELIKASRKMRDFWAGSWILHYISAHISWKLAQKYGPDSLLYPSLFDQPLIDSWLLRDYPNFETWIDRPPIDSLLTAGFPNVLVLVLPKAKVAAAMQFAEQELKEVWRKLGNDVFTELGESRWLRGLQENSSTWNGWLDTQWQTYWTGVPIGVEEESLKNAKILQDPSTLSTEDAIFAQHWANNLNRHYDLSSESLAGLSDRGRSRELFQQEEIDLLRAIHANLQRQNRRGFSANIGSWWGYIFDTTRLNLGAVKNARTWQLPTVFSTRSTVSGIGAAVYPSDRNDWASEQDVKDFWQKPHANLFNGSEQLNATEVVKRGLHQILPKLLGVKERDLSLAYPDLTAGVAGYLNIQDKEERDRRIERYINACQDVRTYITTEGLNSNDLNVKWGIPWVEKQTDLEKYPPPELKQYPPRLINASWLVEDFNLSTEELPSRRTKLESLVKNTYPSNNPTDWYVLAAGDGDGMSDWLKGINMENYREYIPQALKDMLTIGSRFDEFLKIPKRMGPSTHNALSRALLDFSNRLLPYLTQQRYAGRLIYGGGDDVLAYTNLWEWDKWVWDVRQCFRGAEDDRAEFGNTGDYWRWLGDKPPAGLTDRPLFTMGQKATISFGMTIAHQSTPMAIALEQLWEAEASAKEHLAPPQDGERQAKDAIEIRVIYSNGNMLKATTKFEAFHQWQVLVDRHQDLEDAIFEQAAIVWEKHPAPTLAAIAPWCRAFVERRQIFEGDNEPKEPFCGDLQQLLDIMHKPNLSDNIDDQLCNWLKKEQFCCDLQHFIDVMHKLNLPDDIEQLRKWLKKEQFCGDLQQFIRIMHELNLPDDIDEQIRNWLKLAAFTIRRRKIELGGAA
jgi:CRISPR-associated protein Cmr2